MKKLFKLIGLAAAALAVLMVFAGIAQRNQSALAATAASVEADFNGRQMPADMVGPHTWWARQTLTGGYVGQFPASEVIGAGGVITADVCGGVKRLHTNGTTAVTTDTTNTFTAATATVAGCCMDIINDGTGTITLDNNSLFFSASGGNVALGVKDTMRVCTDGTAWYQLGGTGNN